MASVHFEGRPLYSLKNGARYRYYCRRERVFYCFVKHAEFEFPAEFRLSGNLVVYQYEVGIPESHGKTVIFVNETEIVEQFETE